MSVSENQPYSTNESSNKQSSASTNARNNIINKLKKEVIGADYTKLPDEVSYQYPSLSHEQQVAQFIGHLEANHAQVIKLSVADIAQVVGEQLKQRNISSIMSGKDVEATKQLTKLNSDIAIEIFDFDLAEKFPDNNKEKLFNNTPAGITSSCGAIAATGSIVLWPTINEPRSLSLVPPLHFVIVDANTMEQDFASLMKAQQWHDKLPTNAILISGPSKTADIQQTLAYGAHGPKELIVLLLNS